jgi:hypothetical protein
MTKRAGQRNIPVLDITLATPLEGVQSLKGTGAFDSKRQRIRVAACVRTWMNPKNFIGATQDLLSKY